MGVYFEPFMFLQILYNSFSVENNRCDGTWKLNTGSYQWTNSLLLNSSFHCILQTCGLCVIRDKKDFNFNIINFQKRGFLWPWPNRKLLTAFWWIASLCCTNNRQVFFFSLWCHRSGKRPWLWWWVWAGRGPPGTGHLQRHHPGRIPAQRPL